MLLGLQPVHHAFDEPWEDVLGMLAFVGYFFKSSSPSLQILFIGAKKPTSRGWSLSVALGGRQTKSMSFSLQRAVKLSLMCEARWSQTITFLPSSLFRMGKARF
jgi:hypothetical protein